MATVYLALGSNLGNRRENLESAISAIKLQIGDVLKISTFYDFPAVLNQLNPGPQPDYLNGALACSSRLSPLDLLGKISEIERSLGRDRPTCKPWSARTIDIDILLYDQLILELPNLKIPHPQMHQRDFVLKPLVEIAPQAHHPILNKNVLEILTHPPG